MKKQFLLFGGITFGVLAIVSMGILGGIFVLSSNSTEKVEPNQSVLGTSDFVLPESFYNYSYGEIFVAYRSGVNVNVEIYNTTGVEDYSQSKWDMLGENAIADELGATRVRINQPQYWVVDSVVGLEVNESDFVIELENINMQKVNEIEASVFGGNFSNSPYTRNTFESTSKFTWDADTEVYELTSPAGDVYRMRSYSQSIDPNIELGNLDSLDQKLNLPNGWEFSSRELENTFTLSEDDITVLSDDLGNSYLLIN